MCPEILGAPRRANKQENMVEAIVLGSSHTRMERVPAPCENCQSRGFVVIQNERAECAACEGVGEALSPQPSAVRYAKGEKLTVPESELLAGHLVPLADYEEAQRLQDALKAARMQVPEGIKVRRIKGAVSEESQAPIGPSNDDGAGRHQGDKTIGDAQLRQARNLLNSAD